MATRKPEPIAGHKLSEKFDDPGLVERIFEYIIDLIPAIANDPRLDEMVEAVECEFAGQEVYIEPKRRKRRKNAELAEQVLRIFNGRNASEVARELNISRATVYRRLKQPGKSKP